MKKIGTAALYLTGLIFYGLVQGYKVLKQHPDARKVLEGFVILMVICYSRRFVSFQTYLKILFAVTVWICLRLFVLPNKEKREKNAERFLSLLEGAEDAWLFNLFR